MIRRICSPSVVLLLMVILTECNKYRLVGCQPKKLSNYTTYEKWAYIIQNELEQLSVNQDRILNNTKGNREAIEDLLETFIGNKLDNLKNISLRIEKLLTKPHENETIVEYNSTKYANSTKDHLQCCKELELAGLCHKEIHFMKKYCSETCIKYKPKKKSRSHISVVTSNDNTFIDREDTENDTKIDYGNPTPSPLENTTVTTMDDETPNINKDR